MADTNIGVSCNGKWSMFLSPINDERRQNYNSLHLCSLRPGVLSKHGLGEDKDNKKIIIHTDTRQKKLFKNAVLSSQGNAVER